MPKRRANGEGSIYQRKDGLWAATYTDNAGKRRTLYGKTQQIVLKKLKEAIKQSDQGIKADKSKMKFADWMEEWLEDYAKLAVRPGTFGAYYRDIHRHVIPAFPNVLLKDLTADMLQKFFREKLEGGRLDRKQGGSSVRHLSHIRSRIHTALDQAVENGYIPVNVVRHTKLPKFPKPEVQILTVDEQKRLEAVALTDDNPLSFGIILDLYTGLRVGELAALKISDIDFHKKEIRVRRTVSRNQIPEHKGQKLFYNEPKTEKSNRTIPLPDFIMELLKRYVDERNKRVELMDGHWWGWKDEESAKAWVDEGFLFISRAGVTPEKQTFNSLLNKLLKKCGVDHIKFHALRHTFATRCLEMGFDIKTLADILGHSDAKMTLNIYTHALDEQKRSNMDKLSALFNSDGNDEDEN